MIQYKLGEQCPKNKTQLTGASCEFCNHMKYINDYYVICKYTEEIKKNNE